jgi:hypothetical protein
VTWGEQCVFKISETVIRACKSAVTALLIAGNAHEVLLQDSVHKPNVGRGGAVRGVHSSLTTPVVSMHILDHWKLVIQIGIHYHIGY